VPIQSPDVIMTTIDAIEDAANALVRGKIMGRTLVMFCLYWDIITYAAGDKVLAERLSSSSEYIVVGRLETS